MTSTSFVLLLDETQADNTVTAVVITMLSTLLIVVAAALIIYVLRSKVKRQTRALGSAVEMVSTHCYLKY